MERTKVRVKRFAIVFMAVGALTAALAVPALAVNTVTQQLNGGTLTASIADATLSPLTYAHTDQTNTGTLNLTADDSTGTGAGWNVTVQSSDFVYSGANSGTDIPAANFALTSAAAPTSTAGQAIDPTGGPAAGVQTGTFDSALMVLDAQADYGQGTYTQDLGVELTVPGMSRAGTYTGTLTVTIASGPAA